jgi:hypothetical protein
MSRMPAVAAALLIAGWQAVDAMTPSGVLLAAAAVAVAGLVVLAAGRLAARLPPYAAVPSAALRERAGHAPFIRLRDPDDAGRPRPRAPAARTRAAHA